MLRMLAHAGMLVCLAAGLESHAATLHADRNCVSGRVYSVYWAPDLSTEFVPLETGIPWTVNAFVDTLHGNEGSGFYKLKVELDE